MNIDDLLCYSLILDLKVSFKLFIANFIVFSLFFILCFQDQLTYEFTECDSAEGRWRVAVPKDPNSCEASEVPVRQKECSKCSLITFNRSVG